MATVHISFNIYCLTDVTTVKSPTYVDTGKPLYMTVSVIYQFRSSTKYCKKWTFLNTNRYIRNKYIKIILSKSIYLSQKWSYELTLVL